MPLYTYRREDGSTFDIKQSFTDPALTQDPETGQKVVRLIQRPGVIFKGSGFYITDSKGASKAGTVGSSKDGDSAKAAESKPAETAKTDSTPVAASSPPATAAAD
jgi:predicted nucleic acid-binding Zn ribbon protein